MRPAGLWLSSDMARSFTVLSMLVALERMCGAHGAGSDRNGWSYTSAIAAGGRRRATRHGANGGGVRHHDARRESRGSGPAGGSRRTRAGHHRGLARLAVRARLLAQDAARAGRGAGARRLSGERAVRAADTDPDRRSRDGRKPHVLVRASVAGGAVDGAERGPGLCRGLRRVAEAIGRVMPLSGTWRPPAGRRLSCRHHVRRGNREPATHHASTAPAATTQRPSG